MSKSRLGSSQKTVQEQVIPGVAWLAACFLLAGLGTVILGPILPAVAARWHLGDAESGRLFFAKFAAACAGGILVSRHLRRSLLLGTLLSAVGFAGFGLAPNFLTATLCLAVAGFGLGQLIASANTLAAIRFRAHTGSGLAAMNFFFSLGAVLTGVLTARLLPSFGLRMLLVGFAAMFLLCMLGTGWSARTSHGAFSAEPQARPLAPATLVLFGALLFLYGGLETSLSSWLTTYSQRYGAAEPLGGQSALVLFWSALTVGRVLASAALRFVTERVVSIAGMLFVAAVAAFLAVTHMLGRALVWECVLLGLALAPFFPATFALLMQRGPSARVAGTILAVSGLGAGLFPWLMGVVSAHAGSLKTAMLVPASLAVALLVLSALPALRRRPG